MNTQDIPVKDQDTPFIEEHEGQSALPENGTRQPEPVAARPAAPEARPSTPAPSLSPERPPVWTGYPPGAPPPWAWQPGV